MANGNGNGGNWYARLAALLILAIVGWCVVVVSTGSQKVHANSTKIEVHDALINRACEDIKEIKDDVKELLRR